MREEENERVDAVLVWVGDRKINVIKLVRETIGLGLAEARDFIENVPQTLMADISLEEGEALQQRFYSAGATISLRPSSRPQPG